MDGRVALADRIKTMRNWRWGLWVLCLAIWTVLLLRPEPAHFNSKVIAPITTLPVTKFVHVGVYAFLTALGGTLSMVRRQWLLLGVLLFHAMITEYLQTFVESRSGKWSDVGLNLLGMALGLALSWRCWIAARPSRD
jgi:VanZ family protein